MLHADTEKEKIERAKKESELRRLKAQQEEEAAKAAKEAEEKRLKDLEDIKAKALQEKHKAEREAFLKEKALKEKEADEQKEREGCANGFFPPVESSAFSIIATTTVHVYSHSVYVFFFVVDLYTYTVAMQ